MTTDSTWSATLHADGVSYSFTILKDGDVTLQVSDSYTIMTPKTAELLAGILLEAASRAESKED